MTTICKTRLARCPGPPRRALATALLVTLALSIGCRDGLLQPPPEAEPDASGCFPLFFVAPGDDAPYEIEGMLVNLIVVETRSGPGYDAMSADTRVEAAAAEVLARFPEPARAHVEPHVEAAITGARDYLAAGR